MRRSTCVALLLAAGTLATFALTRFAARGGPRASSTATRKSVDDRVREYGRAVDERLRPRFAANGIAYPPSKLAFIGIKDERVLHLLAAGPAGRWRVIKTYPVLAASGNLGPKLREGDLQVPEGLYRISLLNPNSAYHLSLRVDYPNAFDRRMAAVDRRTRLGGDIMIHGKAVSIGCLAIGDEGAEELFILAARTGIRNIAVILSPVDFRRRELPARMEGLPAWSGTLYQTIREEIRKYPVD